MIWLNWNIWFFTVEYSAKQLVMSCLNHVHKRNAYSGCNVYLFIHIFELMNCKINFDKIFILLLYHWRLFLNHNFTSLQVAWTTWWTHELLRCEWQKHCFWSAVTIAITVVHNIIITLNKVIQSSKKHSEWQGEKNACGNFVYSNMDCAFPTDT